MHLHHVLRRGQALLRHPGRLSLLVLLVILASWPGCSQPEMKQEAVTPTLVEDSPKELRILRSDYEAVIKDGIQPVMRWYLTMPAYDAGQKFLGFRIVRILKDDLKDGPVKVGDVLRQINGRPIETPGQVEIIWRELWPQKLLTISLIRENQALNLTIPITTPDAPASSN